jgi:agmatinase
MIAADVVDLSPAYDHAEITALAAATVAYEVMSVMAVASGRTS